MTRQDELNGCNIRCKDTNLKAIHNCLLYHIKKFLVAISDAKIQIWKQFTTRAQSEFRNSQLQYPMQRYKFESNSQPTSATKSVPLCCNIRCKDTNLKAIHNGKIHHRLHCRLQYPMQRYKFESNSQRIGGATSDLDSCNIRCKDTNLKAIHNLFLPCLHDGVVAISDAKIQIWKQFTTWPDIQAPARRCNIRCKDTNLKAIHNCSSLAAPRRWVAISDAKIQIWKQFTTPTQYDDYENCCNIRCKDTNLKAIHNFENRNVDSHGLQYPMQRYKFESNSQLEFQPFMLKTSCNIRCKDTNLKAIHNWQQHSWMALTVAISDAKIQIWKQFTTCAWSVCRP